MLTRLQYLDGPGTTSSGNENPKEELFSEVLKSSSEQQ
jgi:hypothetical protein